MFSGSEKNLRLKTKRRMARRWRCSRVPIRLGIHSTTINDFWGTLSQWKQIRRRHPFSTFWRICGSDSRGSEVARSKSRCLLSDDKRESQAREISPDLRPTIEIQSRFCSVWTIMP